MPPSPTRSRRRARRRRRAGWALAVVLFAFWLSLAPRDPALFPARGAAIAVHVVDHGYHTGLVIPRATLHRAAAAISPRDAAAAERLRWLAGIFPDADWIEVGWGDSAFYRSTPTIGDVDIGLGLRALIVPTAAVLQVVPGTGPPDRAFPASDIIRLGLSPGGLAGLARRLAATVAEPPPGQELGPSLYGAGAFFDARLDYHLLRTCNHWIAWLLRGAGVPSSAVPGTFSTTLMLELRWRAGQG